MPAMQAIPADHPLMRAWETYKKSEDFENSKHWALTLCPNHGGTLDHTVRRIAERSILSLDTRERHVEGALWAAFMAGFFAAGGEPIR